MLPARSVCLRRVGCANSVLASDPRICRRIEFAHPTSATGACHRPSRSLTTQIWVSGTHTSFISQNWRGKPLVSHQVIINLIAATTTRTGLKVYARLDERDYPKKIAVTDQQLAAINLKGHDFHPEWNYTISPTPDTTKPPR